MSDKSGPAIGAELCRLFGLQNVVSLTIECSVEHTLTMTVKQFITRDQEAGLIGLLRKYKISEELDSPVAIPLNGEAAYPALEKTYHLE